MEYSLKQLDAEFIRYVFEDGVPGIRRMDSKEGAQGIMFACPLCYERNGGLAGTHSVICWSRSAGTPDDVSPGPGRWMMTGRSLDDLTLDEEYGHSRSVHLQAGCGWHGYVTNGKAG